MLGLTILPVSALTLSALFDDHAVLQRDMEIPVWGWAAPGERVSVKLGDRVAVETVTGSKGEWQVRLPPQRVSAQPQSMLVSGTNETIMVKDLLIGDVWLCSGQSNMKVTLAAYATASNLPNTNLTLIRQFGVPLRAATDPRRDVQGNWQVYGVGQYKVFTAVGFYFARKIYQATGVPIGLLNAGWGGTQIEAWLAPQGVAAIKETRVLQDALDAKMIIYRKEVERRLPGIEAQLVAIRLALQNNQLLPPQPDWPVHPVAMGELYSLYYGLIHPLVPYALRGVVWYQGENNMGEGDEYYHKMRALIGGWRQVWGQGEFPFYFVQIANFRAPTDNPAGGHGFRDPAGRDSWAPTRWAQTRALAIPRTGMAVTIDIGDADNVHPANKLDVGERLALWALKNDYGQSDIECSGPIFRELKVEGNRLRLYFDHVGRGLMVGHKEGVKPTQEDQGGKLKRFAVSGGDGRWQWAEAVIEPAQPGGTAVDTVVISSTNVPQPVAVRYAYSMNPAGCNLYNRDGLPASPFKFEPPEFKTAPAH